MSTLIWTVAIVGFVVGWWLMQINDRLKEIRDALRRKT
jgi:hypothetical protein